MREQPPRGMLQCPNCRELFRCPMCVVNRPLIDRLEARVAELEVMLVEINTMQFRRDHPSRSDRIDKLLKGGGTKGRTPFGTQTEKAD